ncbi:hypothetical protein Nepgr_021033 [Nepenthes gracilis]|uniref:Uncharacterized protein n=1 Tax=Nepenthes gracilis TaxID=150966 RepID=A0AAD3SY61_NEPGR|nr:hypothetical protein Nepgr_021033 [Nepenthes gracilis]
MERLHFARICIEVCKNAPLPTKIRVNYGGNEVAKTVDIEVAFHWRPVHHVKGRTANQKSTREVLPDRQDAISKILPGYHVKGRSATQKSFKKITPAHQVVATLNLSPEYPSVGRGPISAVEQVASDAKHKVPVERGLPADFAKESFEQLIPPTPPALNHDAAEGLMLDGIVSDNSFMILRDPEGF